MVLKIKFTTNKFMEYTHHVLLYSIHGTWCPDGIDELNFHGQYHCYQRGHPLRRADQMSTSLMKVAKPFNTGNNTSGGYKDNCMDRWKPIEVHIIEHKALPRKALKPQ